MASDYTGQAGSISKVKSAATANPVVVKAAPGILATILLTNDNASKRYIKFYDTAATPLVTDPVMFTLMIPAGGGIAEKPDLKFNYGIAYRITTAIAESDTGATGADEVTGVIGYV